jgi:phage terminase small subunit
VNSPTSARLKIIRGDPGKRGVKAKVSTLPTKAPECPPDITADPVALEAWNYYVPLLILAGNVTEMDRSVIKSLCFTTSILERTREEWRNGGSVQYSLNRSRTAKKSTTFAPPNAILIKGARGAPVKNPYLIAVQDLQREERQYLEALGLQPRVRGLNTVPAQESDDKWDL